jgi:4-amino-4-deoxy-L-arabinose transferase-like glycosyltransferase
VPQYAVTEAMATNEQSLEPANWRKDDRPTWLPFLIVGITAALLFTLRLAAPPNLLDQDQERPASYVLDVVKNGNWLCQRDLTGDITSKPPLYTWLCALLTLACGRINVVCLYLPGALAAFGAAMLILILGRRYIGVRAGLMGAIACMLTSAGVKEFALARTDGVFSFMVTAAAFFAFRAWILGRGWTWFWLMSAGATLTKGPLGLVLAGSGLLAAIWERKSGHEAGLKGKHWGGIVLFLAITAGWFLLAYLQAGPPLIKKMIGRELVDHAVAGKHAPGTLIYQQPLYYLGRAAPWSLFAYLGLWRLCKWPAMNDEERRLERFLFCWFVTGLLIFSLAPHQRADLLWPIMPAAALIAGRELARLTQKLSLRAAYASLCLVIAIGVAGFAVYYCGPRARNTLIQQTIALKKLAYEVERHGGRDFPLQHVDDPMAFQFYLDSLRAPISFERAAELLRGPEPAFIAVNNLAKLEAARKTNDPPLFKLLPAGEDSVKCPTHIVGNRPELAGGK